MIKNIDHSSVIHYGSDSIIIKTLNGEPGKPFCLKILIDEFPSVEVITQFENEFEILTKIKCGNVRRAFKKEKYEDHPALVLEYIDGKDLNKFLSTESLDLMQQIELAAELASALYDLQKENIFHGQVHPGNIIIEKNTNKVFFIDFGFATQGNVLEPETNTIRDKDVEPLKYISPEQTGRINRPVDNRADLYSLGVIFYRLFTGALPFENKEGLELIYAHVARNPTEPYLVNPGLPRVISDIIMKLLAKNAEERYQSAFGVKADLEKCLQYLHDKKKIEFFSIAKDDFSGKLFVPHKLYGREKEIKYLHQVFEECNTGKKSTILISGYSGSGKSTLIETVQKDVSQRKDFFIKGKFDQISSDTPYPAFIQAFSELFQLILYGEESYRLKWKKKIMDSMGNSVKILAQFIPGIESLVGKLPDISIQKGIEAQNRLNYEFTRFLRTITDKDHPLVIFIDDLQWADASSLNLFKVIAENKDLEYLTLVGAFRKNEVDENHPLAKTLGELRDENAGYIEIDLKDLSFEDVHELVRDSLVIVQDNISFLADIIYSKTKGNAFYVLQFLKSIYEEGFLRFDFDERQWLWNSDLILQLNVSGNVAELMTSFVQKLSEESLDLLQTASAIGNRFDKRTLSVIKQLPEKKVEKLLNNSVHAGLVLTVGQEYKFAHDRIQQAIYSLLSESEKALLHLTNGRRLVSNFSQHEIQDKLFELVNQWNLGIDQITDKKEKVYLANLNLMAGEKAIASTAYPQALQYFEKGILLFDEEDWNSQYDFLLKITTAAAEAAYLSGSYESVEKHVGNLLAKSKTLMDSVNGYEIEIKKLIAQNKLPDAIRLGLSVLEKLGIRFPPKPNRLSVIKGLLKTKWILRNKTMEYFNNLSLMQDEQRNTSMRIMYEISAAAFFAVPNLVPLLVFRMVEENVRYGLSKKSPFCISAYGFILSVHVGEIDKGSRYGDLALHLVKKIDTEEVAGSILATSNIFLDHWKKPLSELRADMDKAFKTSIEFGNNEWASYSAHNIVYQLFIAGINLQELSRKAESLDLQIEKFKQDLTLKRFRLFRQAIDNLMLESDEPDVLTGKVFSESAIDINDVTKASEIYFQNLYIVKLQLALLFNNTEHAKKYLDYAQRFQETVKGTALEPLLYFFRSLAISNSSVNTKVNKSILRQVRKDIKALKKFEKISPQYNTHKTLLLQAEYFYLQGKMESAKIYYDKALKEATQNNMPNDLALCWERTGQFFLNTKQELLADFYLRNAYSAYKRWGASAKLKHMETQYPQLKISDTELARTNESVHAPGNERAVNLDLNSILKASAAISGEIVLPRLLKKMMQIIMENAGAEKGFLIMEKKNERLIEAEITANTDEVRVLEGKPLKNCGLLAESIVNYVSLTHEPIILDDALKNQLFSTDPFIEAHGSKSVLCIPLINMGKLLAIIYLSNDLTYGAFTKNRVELLKLLAIQMAVSIENALFYNELENKVEERTNELYLEKRKSDELLLNILPEDVAMELKQTGRTIPRSYEVATVMFTDFEDFTLKSEKLTPEELVSLIDTCFRKFDEIISRYEIEKIKTIGDAYLCVSGLPDQKDHSAENVVKAALEIVEVIKAFGLSAGTSEYFNIRIGIHTGPLVAGVVGDKKFAYDVWGDTVNVAARMEQNSESNRINISQSTYELVKDKFNCAFRGKRAAKNKGMIEMYFVEGEK